MAVQVSDNIARSLAESGDYFKTHHDGWITTHVNKNNPEAVRLALAANAKKYADEARQKAESKPKDPWKARNDTRVIEFQKIFQHRYRGILPDDDSGLSDLIPAIRHILSTESRANARRFAESWAPWCVGDRFDEIAEEIGSDPTPQRAWALGKEIGLTYGLRKYLKIRTIGPCDVTREQFKELKRQEDAERKRFKRILEGKPPRSIYESLSKTKTQPWKIMGWSKPTYHRRVKKLGQAAVDAMIEGARVKSETSPSGVDLQSLPRTHLSQLADPVQRWRGIMPDRKLPDGAFPAGGNRQAGAASNDNLPPPAEWETPTEVAA